MQTKHPTDVEVLFLYPKSKEGEMKMSDEKKKPEDELTEGKDEQTEQT